MSGSSVSSGARPSRRPRLLRPGDRVVVITPSGPVKPDRLRRGCAVLREYGLDVTIADHALDRTGAYLAGDDAARAKDFQQAWLDPDVAGILCARGGYGAMRMIDLVDWEALAVASPTLFVGSSDVTALHEAIAAKLGVATLFGPMVATGVIVGGAGRSLEALWKALVEDWSGLQVDAVEPWALNPSVARGVTLGGNLSLLAATIGSAYARPAAGGIVLLEDVGEEPYRVDRILTQLLRAGWFDGVAGIALGTWIECGRPGEVDWVLRDRLGGLGVPVLGGLPIGHGPLQASIPLGVPAELDTTAGNLRVQSEPGGAG